MERTYRKREVLYTVHTVVHVRDMFMVYIYMIVYVCMTINWHNTLKERAPALLHY